LVDGCGARSDVELGQDGADMVAGSLGADMQCGSDLGPSESIAQKFEDLLLSRGEPVWVG